MAAQAAAPSALYWLLVIAPALPYVVLNISYRRILKQKITEAAARLTPKTAKAYAKAYGDPDVTKTLQRFYHWSTYIAPLVLTSVIAATFATIALAKAQLPLALLSDPVMAAMRNASLAMLAGALGAYLFGLDDLVRRHATADLSSSALHTTWVRIAMSAGVGAMLPVTKMPDPVALPLAFAVGTLPLSSIWTFVRQRFGLTIDEGKVWEADLHLIEGMTKATRDRLIAEDIDNVQRLAYADPVRLLFRTNIEWNVILDFIDQALLISYVREKIVLLRGLGIRGAIEVAELYDRNEDDNEKAEIAHAKRMLARVGKIMGNTEDDAINLAYQMSNDPLVDFVWWHYDAVYSARNEPAPPPPVPIRNRLAAAMPTFSRFFSRTSSN